MALGSRYTVLTQLIDDGRLVRSTDADPTVVLLPDQVAPLVAIGAISPTPLATALNESQATEAVLLQRDNSGYPLRLIDTAGATVMPLTDASLTLAPTPPGPYTAAASATQASGIIGTMLASPTAVDTLTKFVRVDLPAGTRAVRLNMAPLYAAKAIAAAWLTFDPGDDYEAGSVLAARDPARTFRLLPGEGRAFGVGRADLDLSAVYVVFELGAGSVYTDVSLAIECYQQPVADQIALALDRSATLRSAHLFMPFHEASGATAANSGSFGGATVTINGTTSAIWGTRGSITPVGDNYGLIGTESKEFLDLTTLPAGGGIFMSFRATRVTQHSSGLQALFGHSPVDTEGGFEFGVNATGALLLTLKGDGLAASTQAYNTMTLGQEYCYAFWLDRNTAAMYGVRDGGTTLITKAVSDISKPPRFASSRNLALLRRSAASPAADTYLGANSGVHRLRELFIARVEADLISQLPAAADLINKSPGRLPKAALRALGF